MKEWSIKIRKISNGFITTDSDMEETNYEIKNENDITNRDHVIKLLYDLIDYFTEYGGRYDKRRITINYKKGDKYEGDENPEEGVEFPIIEERSK